MYFKASSGLPFLFILDPNNVLITMRPFWVLILSFIVGCAGAPEQKSYKVSWRDYRKGYDLINTQPDSAFFYFNRSATSSKDSSQVAMAYLSMAMIQTDFSDHIGAQESLTSALRYLDDQRSADKPHLANVYNELGMNSANLKDYKVAIQFYDQALSFTSDTNVHLVVLNNKANAYQESKDFRQAIKMFEQLLSTKHIDPEERDRILTNQATTFYLADSTYDAGPQLLRALRKRRERNDLWGMNSSYVNLSKFYLKKKPELAFFYANKMYRTAEALRSPDDRLEALSLTTYTGKPQLLKTYFRSYQLLMDSLLTVRNSAKKQFAMIRYDAEKSKAENLTLQKDNAEKKYQIGKQQVLLYCALAVLIAGSVGGHIWYKRRKERSEQAALDLVRESELRTSKKVHDVVANGIYGVMSEIEHQEFLDRDRLLDKMEVLYERSRDISYEPPRTGSPDFHQHLGKLMLSFATSGTKVVLVGNEASFWQEVSTAAHYELEHILQELMVNMRKHSGAKNVVLKFEAREGNLLVSYQDDGRGLKEGTFFKNGLTSTGNRINAIGGRITFENNTGTGLAVQLCFPRS